MMKRMLSLLLVLLLLPWGQCALAAAPGDEVTVTFAIVDNAFGAISARVGFSFDDEVFEFVRSEKICRDVLTGAPDSPEKNFGLVNLGGIQPGVLGTVTLRIREDAPAGVYAVMPQVDSVYNGQKEEVSLNIQGGTVTVEGPGGGFAPLPGDADGNARVDAADALLICKYITGWQVKIHLPNADKDADGKVDFCDAVIILLRTVGWKSMPLF